MTTTADAIRRMDGPALTRAAFALGLSPAGTQDLLAAGGDVFGEAFSAYDPTRRLLYGWHPHRDRLQAEAVFRRLRARGWSTAHLWYGTDGNGVVTAGKKVSDGLMDWTMHRVEYVTEHDEALALVRVSVLACSVG